MPTLPPLTVHDSAGQPMAVPHEELDEMTHALLHDPESTSTERGMANAILALLDERVRLLGETHV